MTKRVLALLMVMAMMLSLVPAVVTAEEAAATPGYTLIMQKAHNQTDGSLAVDVYLQANTAEQGDVTAYDFVVTPAEGLELALPVDATGNNGLAFNGETSKLVYDGTTAPAIPVGTDKVLVAALTVSGESIPANVAEAITLSEVTVTTATGFYSDDAADAATEGYAGTVAQKAIASACNDHECKHGKGTWTALTATAGELAAGNYYLTSDVQLTGVLSVAASAEVSICLNGFDMTAKANTRMFEMNKAGATLNICDCTATGEGADYTAGKLIPTYNHGGALRATNADNTTINFFGGVIDGTNSNKKEASVALITGATLNMLGGKVQNFDDGLTSSGNHYGPIIIRGKADGADGVATIADVTFVNCGSGIISGAPGGSDRHNGAVLTVEDVTVMDSASGATAVEIATNRFKSVTLKGDCKFDAPVSVWEGAEVTLDLGANADINILTAEELTEEQFNAQVKMSEGGSLTAGTLLYETVGVFVEYADGKFAFSDGHIHDGVPFKIWDKTDSLPSSGNYYLLHDVTLDVNAVSSVPADEAVVTVGAGKVLNLDLNGKTITQNGNIRIFSIKNGGTLSIYDCAEPYDAEGNWTGGVITGSTCDAGTIRLYRGAVGGAVASTFNLYGGRIAGNGTDTNNHNGGAIYIYDAKIAKGADATKEELGGIFNMYGGEIYNNKAAYAGSAITMWSDSTASSRETAAQINIYGGKIHGNVTNGTDAAGAASSGMGVIWATGYATVNITGGEIYNNSAKNGGVIYAGGNAQVNITDSEIYNNSATSNGGAFYLNDSAELKISDVEIHDNAAVSYGGAVYLTGSSKLIATNAKVNSNTADCGGAIAHKKNTTSVSFTGGQLNYNTCTNKYDSGGGAVLFMDVGATASFTNVEMKGNSAKTCSGGVIQQNSSGTVTLTNCTLTENTSAKIGAVIFARGSSATPKFYLNNTVITGNTSGSTEGAVYMQSAGNLYLSGSTVIAGNINSSGKNTATTDLRFTSNTARTAFIQVDELESGAHVNVHHEDATELEAASLVKIQSGKTQTAWDCGWIRYSYKDATASKSVAYRDTDGDGVKEFTYGHWHTDANGNEYELTAWESTTTLPDVDATEQHYYLVADVTVASSSAASTMNAGGSLELCFNGYTVKASKTGYSAFATSASGAGATLVLTDCTATYDNDGYLLVGGKLENFTRNGNGAAIAHTSSVTTTTRISGIEFANCLDTQKTASLGYGGGVIHVRKNNSLYVDGCKFTGNTTYSGGGAIQVRGDSGDSKTIEIKNSLFVGNHAGHNGGAISLAGNTSGNDKALIENCKFDGNTTTTYAAANATEASSDSGRGGAIFVNKATANVKNCEFVNNAALHNTDVTVTLKNNAQGGAIYVGYSSKLTLDSNCTFTGNHSDQFGGAIFSYIANTYAGTFKNNTSDDHGGAICQYDGNATVASGAVFEGNTAVNGGGAIFHTKGLTVSNATFKNNSTSAGQGGAIFSELVATATATIKDGCTFEGNTAPHGGAIGTETGSYTLTLNITGGSFKKNTVPTNKWSIGGAIRLGDNTKATISGATFDGNQAQLGGVFYTSESGGAITATDCVFTNNYASSRGGVAFLAWGGAMKFDGCTFDNNSAVNHGGAIHSEGNSYYSLTIGATKACTFTNNSAKYGGAISATSGNNASVNTPGVNIYNSTFTGNTGSSGGAIYTGNGLHASNTGYPLVTVSGCTIQENTAASDGSALSITGMSQVTMRDTTIENNTDEGYFSAVFVQTAASKLTLSGKMVIANNVGNTYPVANLHFRDTSAVDNNPTVTFDGLTAGSKIGISATNTRYNTLPVVGTINLAEGTTYEDVAGYFFTGNENRYITHVTDAGELMLTNYVAEDGTTYQTLNEAIAAAVANGETTFVVQAGNKIDQADVELGGNLTIDLNGKDITKIVVAEGAKLSLIDSQTNDYDVADGVYGNVVVEGDYDNYYVDENNRRYVVVADEDGVLSSHRVYLGINKKVLRTANAGIGFKAIFAGDQVVEEYITGYGIKVWKTENPDGAKYADFMHYEFENGTGNGAPNQVTAVIKNVLEKDNAENQARFETEFTGAPVITIGEGEAAIVIEGKTVTTSMNAIAKGNASNEAVLQLLSEYTVTIQ